MDFKKLFEKLKGDCDNDTKENKTKDKSTITNLLILFLVGVLILITANFFKSSQSTLKAVKTKEDNKKLIEEETSNASNGNERELENKLKNILQQTQGVGRVEVMIYNESGEEQVPAFNVNDSTNVTEETDNEGGKRNTTQKNNGTTVVITNDGDKAEPFILKKYKPKVTGVLVVAEGAENKITELRIKSAVVELFNINDEKVNVYPMKK